jgi:hypothetical protein
MAEIKGTRRSLFQAVYTPLQLDEPAKRPNRALDKWKVVAALAFDQGELENLEGRFERRASRPERAEPVPVDGILHGLGVIESAVGTGVDSPATDIIELIGSIDAQALSGIARELIRLREPALQANS